MINEGSIGGLRVFPYVWDTKFRHARTLLSRPAPMNFDQVYDELKRLAHIELNRHQLQSLNTTGLVHEAYLKLAQAKVEDREHGISLVVRAMRQVLIDAARARSADKRGNAPLRVKLTDDSASTAQDVEFFALDQALERLKGHHERLGRVVELHFFGGVNFGEIAELLGVDRRTVSRDWVAARALLARDIDG